jgi:tRNA-specific 2-thiouridylase
VDGIDEKVKGGRYLDVQGNDLGEHDGYPFYTIGQRKGLGRAFGEPMYVTEIKPDTNEVVLGRVDDLLKQGMYVNKLNWMKYPSCPSEKELVTKVRYKDTGTMSKLILSDNDQIKVEFLAEVRGVAPGQSAVFYEGEDVVGGGVIVKGL